ncbi:MAG: acetylglutamate kinase [Candidatus Schekmanbacteria bacterium]|nr:acetylglutamate kinase [Candidatus Schekmanbacteria bacterium]
MKTTQDIIVRLLRNIASSKEIDLYLKLFSSVESKHFAIIKVGGAILRDDIASLASSLTFLHRVGLYPIVIHGAGPQLNDALRDAGIETNKLDGIRVTCPPTLTVARRVFQQENLRLVEALEDLGTRARPIPSGVFEAELLEPEKFGLVGQVTQVHLEAIDSSIRSGHLPILASLGETRHGQIVNINADVAARELAVAIKPFKIVFLTETGGLLDGEGKVISSINLEEDYETLMAQPWIHSGMRLKVQEIHYLLGRLPTTSSVSITSPDHLARELFTHRGSGTLVRRGERIQTHQDLSALDIERLRELLERCFERKLAEDYFTARSFYRVYLAESYRATAILLRPSSIPYLDKFAVTQRAQGEGIGTSLWVRMRRDHPKLFWRARRDNPVSEWYFQQSQGSWREGPWTIFWYGLESFDEVKECIESAIAFPATLAG